MEERSSPPPAFVGKARKLSPTTSLRLSLQPNRSPETYVVQIPRDQVYRVPPPENARIVESHRKPDPQKKRKCTPCCWVLSLLVLLAIIIGIVVLVIRSLYVPKCPEFSITNVHYKNVTTQPSNNHGKKSNNHPQPHPQFEIDLKVVNVNERMDVAFGNNGKATLAFKKQQIGQGKSSSISQKPKDSTNVHINLDATKLSGDVQKSFDDNKKPIPMTMSIHGLMKVTSWAKNLKKDVTVTCDFDVQSLTNKSTIKSEDCRTDF